MTNVETQRKLVEILRILDESDEALGARMIAAKLGQRGYPIGERAVRHYLVLLDYKGFTIKIGNVGRVIMEKGLKELNEARVGDRVGFVDTKIDELVYKTNFDLEHRTGDVIVNVAIIDKNDFDVATEAAAETVDSGYTVSPYVRFLEEGDKVGAAFVPDGSAGLVTMCSMTVDGILLKHGVPSSIKYGGLLEVQKRKPVRYTDLISYQGTSLDPIQIFTARQMTSILTAARSGEGKVLANVRTVPVIAAEKSIDLLRDAKKAGIVGWIETSIQESMPGICRESDVVEINNYAGANPMAALYELGIPVKIYSISALMDVKLLNQRL
jgi:HTH-type transcriptional regulator, global nitrogen regulator NrpRI